MSKIIRNLLLVLACLTAFSSQAATASPLGLHFLRKGTPAAPVVSVTYDNRFGTNTTQSAIDGWFTWGLHSGNHRVWADSINGNDSNNCSTAALACATFDHAFSVFVSTFTVGGGDQMMVAGGQGQSYLNHATLANGGYLSNLGGISATYPTVIESYDSTDPSNTAKYGRLTGAKMPVIRLDNTATYGNSFSNNSGDTNGFYAIEGLAFDGQDIEGNGINWQQRHDGLVFQNDRFNNIQLSITEGGGYDATGASYNQTGNISKSSFWGSWASTSTNSQSIYLHATKDFWLQDIVIAHSGWRIGSARDDVVRADDGGATFFNHGNYVSASELGIRIDRAFYIDTAADGFNLRSNGIATSITSFDEPIAGNIGGFSGAINEAPTGIVAQVTDWLIPGSADINSSQPRGYGPLTTNTVGGSFLKNVVAFDNPKFGGGGGIFIQPANNGNSRTISSITHSGTTATVTLASADPNLAIGSHISLDHASPTDYNVLNVAIGFIDSTHFTYTMATTPATNATSVGIYTAQVPQSLLVNTVRSYNYATQFTAGASFQASLAITNTYSNIISDDLAPGGGNQVASGALFPNYKTRDQVLTAVVAGIGQTPAATYYQRKAQLVNDALFRPDLPWSQWTIGIGFTAMGLTPTYTTPAFIAYTDTPTAVYSTSLSNLSISTTSFVHGVSSTALLSGVSALPMLSAPGGLPSGCSISGRLITCNAVSAGTPSVTIRETTQDGSLTHDTVFTFTISFLFGAAPIRRRRRKAANDNEALALAA